MEALGFIATDYALAAVFGITLLERLGAPVPALPVLIVAGAAAAQAPMFGVWALLLGLAASAIGDTVWFAAGRRYGRRVLGLICRVSLSPDACVQQTENQFERYGVAALVIAKFVPGLSTLAPSIAGALRLAPRHFFVFNTLGAATWAGSGVLVGLLLHDQVDALIAWLAAFGVYAVTVVLGAAVAYVLYRWWQRRAAAGREAIPRITPAELNQRLLGGDLRFVFDVRSPGQRRLDARRIPGAQPFELMGAERIAAQLPPDAEVIVYCACPNDASAVQAARALRRHGIGGARPLAGGLDAWENAGLRLEVWGG